MVMATLAWNLSRWFALILSERGRWRDTHRTDKESVLKMRFRTFLQAFMLVPAQVVSTGRRLVLRLLPAGESTEATGHAAGRFR